MNITDEQREKLARMEAEIRGRDMCDHSGELYLTEPTAPPPDGILPVCFGLNEHTPATPPDTAGGREWWAEALKIAVLPGVPTPKWPDGVWMADLNYYAAEMEDKPGPWLVPHASTSRSEAITAAIVAAAEAWEAAK